MDEFAIDRPELNGVFVSMEFGTGGRIQQLWVADPNLPEEGDEFQFVLTPIVFGEEFAEDYYPGTILLGARLNPSEPWVLARNTDAELTSGDDPGVVEFEYEFSLLPEIRATGKFYEVPGPMPHVCWDLRLANRGRASIEIGELAFPMALNNLYEGFGRTEKNGKSIWNDRLIVHKFIGGAASHLFAQRLTADPPGLLVLPGEDTQWEALAHVPASLNTPFVWEGIPVVYVHSQAAADREGWQFDRRSSLVLEPGDSRSYQTKFVAADRDKYDHVSTTIAAVGSPAIKLLPAAVAPADVGIAIEVTGTTPTMFTADREAKLETDADEEGGFCFLKPKAPGLVQVEFSDTKGRTSYLQLCFTEPIDRLINRRAAWIVKHQVVDRPDSGLHRAILPYNSRSRQLLSSPEDFAGPFTIESGLGDALFLAEKNVSYPVDVEIETLDLLIDEFLRDDLQNPADDTVGSAFADDRGVALNYARPHVYPIVFSLYHSMYRVSRSAPTRHEGRTYLDWAYRTALAMIRHGIPRQGRRSGFMGYARVFDIARDLASEGMHDELERLIPFIGMRAEDLLRRPFPYGHENVLDTSPFEEVFVAARYMNDEVHEERAMRCAYAARSASPNWWSYGSDFRVWDDLEHGPLPAPADRGELCLGYTGPENSMMFLETLDRDYASLPEHYMRVAFAGLLSPWALVRPDGGASMAYCPDPASRMFGFHPTTGDLGLALFHYLRAAGAYVLPSRTYGAFTFGCHFEIEADRYVVRPWDGVGRRVVMRQVNAEFVLSVGKIREVQLDIRKRWATLVVENPTSRDLQSELRIRGLWGNRFEILGEVIEGNEGELAVSLPLPGSSVSRLEIKVVHG